MRQRKNCRNAFAGGSASENAGSGARTNLKVGGGVPLHIFGSSSRHTISRFGERFRDGQSVSCLLLFYSRFLRVQPFVKVGAPAPRALPLVPYGDVHAGYAVCSRHTKMFILKYSHKLGHQHIRVRTINVIKVLCFFY